MALTEDGIAMAAATLTAALVQAQNASGILATKFEEKGRKHVFDLFAACRAEVIDAQARADKAAAEEQQRGVDAWMESLNNP